MTSLIGLSGSYVQSILGAAFSGGSKTNQAATNTAGVGSQAPDTRQLSPFAQILSSLQELQQSDPSKFAQVTQQISVNLASAANSAQSNGNTAAAGQLNQLAADFKAISQNGQVGNVQDLAQAIHGHHHRHSHAASADSQNAGATSGANLLLSAFQTNGVQGATPDPLSIISSTLSNDGVGVASSV
jgi:hypothetical protein